MAEHVFRSTRFQFGSPMGRVHWAGERSFRHIFFRYRFSTTLNFSDFFVTLLGLGTGDVDMGIATGASTVNSTMWAPVTLSSVVYNVV